MLFCLWVWGPLEMREAAERMGVSRPTVSGVTDTLERRGLVERRDHAGDARRRTLALTAAGERAFAELFPRLQPPRSRWPARGLEPDEAARSSRGSCASSYNASRGDT